MNDWRGMLDAVVRERGRALFGYAYVLTGDRDAAEDLLQDALVRAFRSGRRCSSVDAAHAYAKRAITTAFIDAARRASSRPVSAGDLTDWVSRAPLAPDHGSRVDAVLDLQSALLILAPRERACVVLRYMDDMTVAGVADTLGLAQGTVKRYLSDAVATLRRTMPGLEFGDGDTVPVVTRDGGVR
ncbi:sigma-70 family RNA polymerase sigma factor [Demequina sp. NBRC 110054]|uniref:sigma-70 family RNA polymerase sigma factor n=1 Tax=Demequina sp. NBRC 110054 TaxID=1570343 RepID=UPI001F415E43|nr:sigma-70 family RNA polymerase sigma factor [Demequina sp. NBRC 110054]